MHCDFSKAELIDLDMALMDKLIVAKQVLLRELQAGNVKQATLEASIERLEALRHKIRAFVIEA